MRAAEGLPTSALLLDLDAVDHNLALMARQAAPVALRPHVKNFRSVDLARRQVAAGAIGVTTATVVEARAMLDAGIPEALIANQVLAAERLDHLLQGLRADARPILAVDSLEGVVAAGEAARRANRLLDVVVEVDVGMDRGGTRAITESLYLAAVVAGEDGVQLAGVMGYEGHTVLQRDAELRAAGARAAADLLAGHVVALRDAGHDVDIVSAGGTNTHATTSRHPIVTELQAGTYATSDVAYEPFAPGFRRALSVVAQVVSAHRERVVLDTGVKTLGASSLALPESRNAALRIERVNDEHALAALMPGAISPRLGDLVRVDVAAAGPAVSCHRRLTVVRGDDVVDEWPILSRDAL